MTVGFQRKLSAGEAQAAQKRIDQLRQREEEKKRTAEAKNALEAYIYSTKDKVRMALQHWCSLGKAGGALPRPRSPALPDAAM